MRDQWGMSNVLKVSLQTTIHSLHDRGWSRRRIARELGIDRETVGRYLRLAKPANSTPGKGVGRKSQCEPLVEVIMAKVEVGLSAQRIYQDLMEENGFTDSYQSVKPGLTFSVLPGSPAQRASGQLCRSRKSLLRSATRTHWPRSLGTVG